LIFYFFEQLSNYQVTCQEASWIKKNLRVHRCFLVWIPGSWPCC